MRGEILSEKGRFGPLSEDDPGVGMLCMICKQPMKIGDRPALVEWAVTGEDAEKAAQGRAHTVEAKLVHETCVFP